MVWTFAFAPSNVVYAGGQPSGAPTTNAAKSIDGGPTWIALPRIGTLGSTVVFGLAVDPVDANRVFAATSTGIYRSTDGGTSFEQVFSNPMFDIAIDPANPQILYGSTQTTGVVKTIDGGEDWSFINIGLPNVLGSMATLSEGPE